MISALFNLYRFLENDASKKFDRRSKGEESLDLLSKLPYGNAKSFSSLGRRPFMVSEVECPCCDADIPLDGDEKAGELVVCSYCNMTVRLLKRKGDWILVEDLEE